MHERLPKQWRSNCNLLCRRALRGGRSGFGNSGRAVEGSQRRRPPIQRVRRNHRAGLDDLRNNNEWDVVIQLDFFGIDQSVEFLVVGVVFQITTDHRPIHWDWAWGRIH